MNGLCRLNLIHIYIAIPLMNISLFTMSDPVPRIGCHSDFILIKGNFRQRKYFFTRKRIHNMRGRNSKIHTTSIFISAQVSPQLIDMPKPLIGTKAKSRMQSRGTIIFIISFLNIKPLSALDFQIFFQLSKPEQATSHTHYSRWDFPSSWCYTSERHSPARHSNFFTNGLSNIKWILCSVIFYRK